MKRLEWLFELEDCEWEDTLQGQPREIYQRCGREVFLLMVRNDLFPIHVLDKAKKIYVRRFYDGKNGRELISRLNISASTFFKWLNEKK